MMRSPSNSKPGTWIVAEPVAMTIAFLAVSLTVPPPFCATSIVFLSTS
jgi:hypothetical protein